LRGILVILVAGVATAALKPGALRRGQGEEDEEEESGRRGRRKGSADASQGVVVESKLQRKRWGQRGRRIDGRGRGAEGRRPRTFWRARRPAPAANAPTLADSARRPGTLCPAFFFVVLVLLLLLVLLPSGQSTLQAARVLTVPVYRCLLRL
jgi:hypothetical protein